HRFHSARIDFFRRIIEKSVDDDFQSAQPMIEDEDVTVSHEEHIGKCQDVFACGRNFRLEQSNYFVADEPDGAAGEPWQLWTRNKLMPCHQPAELIERSADRTESFLNPVSHETNVASKALNNYSRLESNERKAAGHV